MMSTIWTLIIASSHLPIIPDCCRSILKPSHPRLIKMAEIKKITTDGRIPTERGVFLKFSSKNLRQAVKAKTPAISNKNKLGTLLGFPPHSSNAQKAIALPKVPLNVCKNLTIHFKINSVMVTRPGFLVLERPTALVGGYRSRAAAVGRFC